MVISKKKLKVLIFSISSLIMLSSVVFSALVNLNKRNVLNTTEKKNSLKKVYRNTNTYTTNTLVNNLNSIRDYLGEIQTKQKTLLDDINDSAFHTIQKHGAIKHKYIHHANTIIDDADASLKKEVPLLKDIAIIISVHPYNYEYYLSVKHYIIPNYNFFITKNANTNNKIDRSIDNLSYVLAKKNSLNNISLASEEATFSTKKIATTSSKILTAAFRDYHFNANIICFNIENNSFEFQKLPSKNTIKNKLSSVNKNKFLKFNNKTKINSLSYLNKSSLFSLFSTNNDYPNYFNYHKNECFKTHLQFGNIRKFSDNKITYILMPFASIITAGLIVGLITLIGSGVYKYKYRSYKGEMLNKLSIRKSRWYRHANLRVYEPDQFDLIPKDEVHTIVKNDVTSFLGKYSQHGILIHTGTHEFESPFMPKRPDNEKLETVTFKIKTFSETSSYSRNKRIAVPRLDGQYGDKDSTHEEVGIADDNIPNRKIGFVPVVKNNAPGDTYYSREIITKRLKNNDSEGKKQLTVIQVSQVDYEGVMNTEPCYADITNYFDENGRLICLPVKGAQFDLKLYLESDFE